VFPDGQKVNVNLVVARGAAAAKLARIACSVLARGRAFEASKLWVN
jgi:hypothetical protein